MEKDDLSNEKDTITTRYSNSIHNKDNNNTKQKEIKKYGDKPDKKMEFVRTLHKNIIKSVETVQINTSKLIQDQENDLLTTFRARLYDVQQELEIQKNKKHDGALAWIEKYKKLQIENDYNKEILTRLDQMNQNLVQENQRLKNQFTSQENDREYFVKQLVAIKKDNARLKEEYENILVINEKLKDNNNKQDSGIDFISNDYQLNTNHNLTEKRLQLGNVKLEADNRYKEIIKRLKRLLEIERNNLKQVRSAYTTDLQERNELENLLKQCVEDVRLEINKIKRNNKNINQNNIEINNNNNNNNNNLISNDTIGMGDIITCKNNVLVEINNNSYQSQDRQKIIEMLLSQEKVIHLLYDKTFPIKPKKPLEALTMITRNLTANND